MIVDHMADRILVTGGSGFIGTRLVRDLIARGHDVRIFDKNPSVSYPDRVITGDVRDCAQLKAACTGIDTVYHLAAEHRDDVTPLSLYHEVNVDGAANLVRACAELGIRRLVFTSSVAVYGLDRGELDEDFSFQPFNEYGRTKAEAEKVIRQWADAEQTRSLTIVRPCVIFGEGNRGNVYNLIAQIAANRFLMIGNGRNRKSIGYVDNISAFLSTLTSATAGTAIFNYADKPDLETGELVGIVKNHLRRGHSAGLRLPYALGLAGGLVFDLLAKITGRTFPISSVRVRKFCANTVVGTRRLQSTGFQAPYSLQQGLERMIDAEFGKA